MKLFKSLHNSCIFGNCNIVPLISLICVSIKISAAIVLVNKKLYCSVVFSSQTVLVGSMKGDLKGIDVDYDLDSAVDKVDSVVVDQANNSKKEPEKYIDILNAFILF